MFSNFTISTFAHNFKYWYLKIDSTNACWNIIITGQKSGSTFVLLLSQNYLRNPILINSGRKMSSSFSWFCFCMYLLKNLKILRKIFTSDYNTNPAANFYLRKKYYGRSFSLRFIVFVTFTSWNTKFRLYIVGMRKDFLKNVEM